MKRHIFMSVLLVLAFFPSLASAIGSGSLEWPDCSIQDADCAIPDLMSNGSFEEGDYSPTGAPDDWGKDAWQASAIFTWDDMEALGGYRSVKITAPANNDARWIQSVAVEANTLYFLSGWIKTEDVAHTTGTDAGANLSLYGTWERSAGVFGSQDWKRKGLLFNSGDNPDIVVGARLGAWGGDITGTAWFDEIRLEPVVPMDPHPGWKILVLIYEKTDFEVTDEFGTYHHYVASMTPAEMEQAALAASEFVETDIPALTNGNMNPEITIRFPDHPLTQLRPIGGGWWPAPGDTAADGDPDFDSVFVIWDTRATDLTTGEYTWIGFGDGLAAYQGTHQTYNTMQIDAAVARGHRNVFKHEWGHSILNFYEAVATSPIPTVSNHANAFQYVNCHTGQFYVWEDETLANPIPNSIYNNESGFTHDYYSGTTATADQPDRCLGIPPEAWALGGPVTHSGNRDMPADLIHVDIDIKPGSVFNNVNYHSKGKIPVAILSSSDFAAPTDIDTASLTFGVRGTEESLARCNGSPEDVNNDGYADLVCHFYTRLADLRCGDNEALLKGMTLDETALAGSDAVRIVPLSRDCGP